MVEGEEGMSVKAGQDRAPRHLFYEDAADDFGYQVRVRGRTYLWGSAGVAHDVTFPAPLVLHISNEIAGEPVTIGTETAGGHHTTLATIQAGEHFSLPVQGISGVVASASPESLVACRIRKS
jgi:hypothetical protein